MTRLYDDEDGKSVRDICRDLTDEEMHSELSRRELERERQRAAELKAKQAQIKTAKDFLEKEGFTVVKEYE